MSKHKFSMKKKTGRKKKHKGTCRPFKTNQKVETSEKHFIF